MKKFLLITLFPLALLAQEMDSEVFKLENDPPPFSAFALSGSYISVAQADFRSPNLSNQHLLFSQWETALSYKHPFSPTWGLLFGAGWVGSEIDMEQNPEFNKKSFNYVNGLIGTYTTAFPGWLWKFTFSCYIDAEELSFVDYALYQGVVWGKYDLSPWLELDFGFITETGLHKTKLWPIIGFIYIPCERWAISAIYPIDMSINYSFNEYFVASASLRFLRNRHRLQDTEPNPQGIFEYHTTGIELDLNYAPTSFFSIKGFVGSTTKGDFKVSDRNDNHSIHFKFNGAFYGGISSILVY